MTKQQLFSKDSHKVHWIPCSQLAVIWQDAQQPLDERWAKHLADNFDPEQCQPLKVTLPNGNGIYHIIDGQHRKRAVEILWGEHQQMPCEIVPETDPQRAAQLFVGVNKGRKRPTPINVFKVNVTARESDVVAVYQIVTRMGYKISGAKTPKNIAAVTALLSVYKHHNANVLQDTLKIIQAAWGMDANAVVAPFIRGVGAFMGEFGSKVNWQRLKEVLAKRTPGQFLSEVQATARMREISPVDAMKGLLLDRYNKGLRAELKLRSDA
jgi:hypothetical protein